MSWWGKRSKEIYGGKHTENYVKTLAIPCLQNLVQVTLSMSQLFQGSEEEIDMVANLIYWSIYIFLSFCSDTINSFYKATRP